MKSILASLSTLAALTILPVLAGNGLAAFKCLGTQSGLHHIEIVLGDDDLNRAEPNRGGLVYAGPAIVSVVVGRRSDSDGGRYSSVRAENHCLSTYIALKDANGCLFGQLVFANKPLDECNPRVPTSPIIYGAKLGLGTSAPIELRCELSI